MSVVPESERAWGMFVNKFWYLIFLFVALSFVLWLMARRMLRRNAFDPERKKRDSTKGHLVAGFILTAIFLLLVRGWAARPLSPATPLLHLPSQYQPLSENSTITFLYSIVRHQTSLEEKKYYSESVLDSLFSIRHQYESTVPFERKNVIVFVLESFSNALISKNSPLKARTPFLDSLMQVSIVCNNAFANGLESNKGLVALLAGIPPFMDEAYYHSVYGNNPFRGIGSLLKEKGYSTNFFMGASPDHFGFGKLCKLVGIDHYYSQKQYGNSSDHDGTWGIFDHKFLPYAASVIKKGDHPSFSVIFNISSHHPFRLPAELETSVSIPGQNAEQNSITYVDYSIRLFFDSVKSTEWYKNSIFVFVADHALTSDIKPRKVLYSAFQIPFFIHLPGSDSTIQINKTVQQLDLVPSILDLMHYEQPFISFGRSIRDTTEELAVSKIFGNYQIISGSYLLGYDDQNDRAVYLYDYRNDPELKANLLEDGRLLSIRHRLERQLKAVLQRYNNSLLRHKLMVP
jgi:phosphoglycerol transferase MdoB-like AlkP superfamily enzyme